MTAFVGQAWICTVCGCLFDADCAGHPPCPDCPPNRWASRVDSPAGRFAMNRFHQLRHTPVGGCQYEATPQSPVLTAAGVPEAGVGLTLCPAPAAPDSDVCAHHDPTRPRAPVEVPEVAQLDLFSDLFT